MKIAAAKLEQVKAGAKVGEIDANAANVRKIEAQWVGDQATQRTTIQRLTAQLEGDRAAQKATIGKLEALFQNNLPQIKALFTQVSGGGQLM